MDLYLETKKFTGNFKPEFKSMTENFQYKLPQEKLNNQKVQKFVPVLEGNLSVKNAPNFSAKYLQKKSGRSNKCKTFQ